MKLFRPDDKNLCAVLYCLKQTRGWLCEECLETIREKTKKPSEAKESAA